MKPESPYKQERQSLVLIVVWFVIIAAIAGVGASFIPVQNVSGDLALLAVFAAASVVCWILGALFGLKPLQELLAKAEPEGNAVVRSRILTAGSFFEVPAILGAFHWMTSGMFWLYAATLPVLVGVVFFALVPAVNRHFDKLEMLLQRKKDGGGPAVAKKTTYEL